MVAQCKLDKERHDGMGTGVEIIQSKLLVNEFEQRLLVRTLEIIQFVMEVPTHEQTTLGYMLSIWNHLLFPSTISCSSSSHCRDLLLSHRMKAGSMVRTLTMLRIESEFGVKTERWKAHRYWEWERGWEVRTGGTKGRTSWKPNRNTLWMTSIKGKVMCWADYGLLRFLMEWNCHSFSAL